MPNDELYGSEKQDDESKDMRLNELNDRYDMNCEEFALVGLDPRRDSNLSAETRRRADHHARICSKCSALAASWDAAQIELVAYADSTRSLNLPSKVENRLLQQFRLKHQSRRERHTVQLAAWALAAAAVLILTISVWSWRNWRAAKAGNQPTASNTSAARIPTAAASPSAANDSALSDWSDNLLASNLSDGEFTQLPGSSAQELDDAAIVRVGMPRASLAAFGLQVNEERADDWIQVDFLLGNDGSPQAVRLPQ